MNIIEKYDITFPTEKRELLSKFNDVQKDLVRLKGTEQGEEAILELETVEKLIEIIEFTPDSRIERIIELYSYIETKGKLSSEIHYVLLDYMKGNFDALNKIDNMCENGDKNALLVKSFYLKQGTFDVINKKEVRKCLEKLYLLGEGVGKEYMLMKCQTIFSIILLCFTLVVCGVICFIINHW